MIETFVGFKSDTPVSDLEATLEAWADAGTEPVALELAIRKFELLKRVTAENLSRAHYIIADVGYGPVEENFGELAEQELERHPDSGLFGAEPFGKKYNPTTKPALPHTVVVCRKGIITHWPIMRTETYIQEHVQAYGFRGYKTFLCREIHYRRLSASLPS